MSWPRNHLEFGLTLPKFWGNFEIWNHKLYWGKHGGVFTAEGERAQDRGLPIGYLSTTQNSVLKAPRSPQLVSLWISQKAPTNSQFLNTPRPLVRYLAYSIFTSFPVLVKTDSQPHFWSHLLFCHFWWLAWTSLICKILLRRMCENRNFATYTWKSFTLRN